MVESIKIQGNRVLSPTLVLFTVCITSHCSLMSLHNCCSIPWSVSAGTTRRPGIFSIPEDPWDWYYLHERFIFMVNVGELTSPMDPVGILSGAYLEMQCDLYCRTMPGSLSNQVRNPIKTKGFWVKKNCLFDHDQKPWTKTNVIVNRHFHPSKYIVLWSSPIHLAWKEVRCTVKYQMTSGWTWECAAGESEWIGKQYIN